jgi:threonyl-tRNA synthetase
MGETIRRVQEEYSRQRHVAAGYEFVNTRTSRRPSCSRPPGIWGCYAQSMYPPPELEGAKYYRKPMTCPMRILIYAPRGRSYGELPLRLFGGAAGRRDPGRGRHRR